MCFQCIALGPLVSAHPGFKGCGHSIGQCFASLKKGAHDAKSVRQMMDEHANSYLEEVLADMGNFHAITVDGDGNCLAHAVSRCSYQSELYWHAIRSELHQELTEYRQFYIDQFAEVFGDAIGAELDEAIREAGPSVRAGVGEVLSEQQQYMVDEIVQMGFERRKTEKAVRAVGDCTDLEMMVLHLCEMEDEGEEGEEDESVVPMVPAAHRDAQYMSPLHLFGIANVLRRPLVLVSAKSEWAVSNSGVYLPLRHSPANCVDLDSSTGLPSPNKRSPLVIGWSSADLHHYVACWPVFAKDQLEMEISAASLPRDDNNDLLIYGNATEEDANCYLNDGKWLFRETALNQEASYSPSAVTLHAKWKDQHGGGHLGDVAWSQQEMQYAQQMMQMRLMQQLGKIVAEDACDESTIKKLIFKDETFVFISHQLFQSVSSAPPNIQRAMVKRLHKFSRFAGSSAGCAALKAEAVGELEAAHLDANDGKSSRVTEAAFKWQIQVRSLLGGVHWQDLEPEVQQRLNQSIASGEQHPIVVRVRGKPFEFDAYTGYRTDLSDDSMNFAQNNFLGFARSVVEQQRSLIRTVADPDDPQENSAASILQALAVNPAVLQTLMSSGSAGQQMLQQLLNGQVKLDQSELGDDRELNDWEDSGGNDFGFSNNEEEPSGVVLTQLVEYGYSEKLSKQALQATADQVTMFDDAFSLAINWLLDNEGVLEDDGSAEAAENPEEQCAWEVFLDDQFSWVPFEASVSAVLEKARAAGESEVTTTIRGHPYTVQVQGADDNALKQRNELYGTERPVRRRALKPPPVVTEAIEPTDSAEHNSTDSLPVLEDLAELEATHDSAAATHDSTADRSLETLETEDATAGVALVGAKNVECALDSLAALSTQTNLTVDAPQGLTRLLSETEGTSGEDNKVAVEDQAVCEVYEDADGLVSTVNVTQVDEFLSNEPLWIRQLALHTSWSKRFERAKAPSKLGRTNSAKPATHNESSAPAGLRRVVSCPPEPGSFGGHLGGSTKDYRVRALHNLFADNRSQDIWCPFKE